jgi:hypothetical protein
MPINSLMRGFIPYWRINHELVQAGWGRTMPTPTDTPDRNFGPIEVAIRETARGRAFLAEYARRVRESDTLTLLAMVRRLERVCQELSVRRVDLDEHAVESGSPAAENSSGLAGRSDLNEMAQVAAIGFADADQNRQTLDRIAHLVDALRYPERSAANLSNREAGIVPETTLAKKGEIDVRSAERDGNDGPLSGSPDCRSVRSQQDVLDDIAKALECLT